MGRFCTAAGVLAVALGAAACDASKSSNPLTPTVAGPIPGINISAPASVGPSAGTKIAVDQQPLTLTVNNATTNGPRPLSYVFEVATDAGFTNLVFSRDGIAPGSGQTTLKLPDKLAPERTYYWHARAQDGANTGPFSAAVNFNVYTPIVIQAPTPIGPVNNIKTDSLRPQFLWANAAHSGPVGAITYTAEVFDSAALTNKVGIWTVAEQSSKSGFAPAQDFIYTKQYFWHVRAADPTTVGPWSAPAVFQTPDPPPVVAPSPGGGGPAAGDQINLNLAAIYSAPVDIASWPVTESITQLTMTGGAIGLSFAFNPTLPDAWKWPTSPGSSDNYQYTVWACVQTPTWACSGFIQMWQGRPSTGAPILAQWNANWAYSAARWGPMASYVPKVGDQMAFFVSAGNARGTGSVTSVRERSNVVVVALPPNDTGSFAFSAGAPIRLR